MDSARTDPPYGWVIVAVGALLTCIGFGATFSLAVFLQPITAGTGWAATGVSAAMTLVFVSMGVGAFAWGALSDRWGPRIVATTGAALLGLGIVLSSRAQTLLQFQLSYGVLVGFAAGSIMAPMMVLVTAWFQRRRSLAVSLVSAGLGVAPMTISPLAAWLISQNGWRSAQLAIGVGALLVMVPASLLVRRAPAAAVGPATPAGATGAPSMTVPQALRTGQFAVLALTYFLCCSAHSGPIFHTVSYAMFCGIPALGAVTIYSAEGFAGLVGRVLLGVGADRLGARRVLVAGLLVQAVAAAAYATVRSIEGFYAVALVFGLAYGGVMPLYAVIARQYFPPKILGTVFGAITMTSSIGMAAGPLLGGWVFDTFRGYTWLYVASAALGGGAVLMSLLLPARAAGPRLQPAAAAA